MGTGRCPCPPRLCFIANVTAQVSTASGTAKHRKCRCGNGLEVRVEVRVSTIRISDCDVKRGQMLEAEEKSLASRAVWS